MKAIVLVFSAGVLMGVMSSAQSSELDQLKEQLVSCLSGKNTKEEVLHCRGFYSDECGMKAEDLPMMTQIGEQAACITTEEKAWLSAADLIAQKRGRNFQTPDFARCDAVGADLEAGAAASVDEADCRLGVAIQSAVTVIFE